MESITPSEEARSGAQPSGNPDGNSMTSEYGRKLLHVIVVVIPLTALAVGKTVLLPPLAFLAAMALVSDVVRARSTAFESFIQRFFGFMMRPTESAAKDGRTVVNGATWVLLSLTALLVLFPTGIAVAAFVSFILADAAAALVGQSFGSRQWPGSSRTIEGSIAFILTGGIVLSAFPGSDPAANALAIVVGAAAEVFSERIDDNVLVPFSIAMVLWSVPTVLG